MSNLSDRQFICHIDPRYGWVAVYTYELDELGIRDKISSCSYQCNNLAFLEEDIDAGIFINAYKQKFGKEPNITDQHYDSSCYIRNYCRYSKTG